MGILEFAAQVAVAVTGSAFHVLKKYMSLCWGLRAFRLRALVRVGGYVPDPALCLLFLGGYVPYPAMCLLRADADA